MRKIFLFLLIFTLITGIFVVGEVKYGGVPVFGFTSGLQQPNYNPFSPGAMYGIQGTIFEPLMFLNTITGDVKPWLASSYEWKNNNLELVFNLRRDVKWTDGVPFTAKDVEFTFNMLKAHPEMDLNGIWSGGLESVTSEGSYTVIFKFSKPNVPKFAFIGGLTPIVPQHIWSRVKNPPKFMNPNPVGTGPFILEKFDQALQVETYRKNPNYWQKGKPYVDGLKIRIFRTNNANNLATIKGEIDWSSSFMPDVKRMFIDKNPEVNHAWVPHTGCVFLYPNNAKYPFNISKFRLALSMAIDKAKVAKIGEYGYTPPAHPTGLQTQFIDRWFDKSLEPLVYSYDPQRSIEILKSLGLKQNSSGFFINPKTGKPFSFNIIVVSGWTDWITSAGIIADNLRKVGLSAAVQQMSYGQYMNSLYTGLYDLAIAGPFGILNPYYAYNAMLNSKFTAPIGKNALTNWERWKDPVTDAMLNLFETTSDVVAQKRAMAVIERIMLTDVPTIPLFYTPVVEEFSTRRFVGWPSESNPYTSCAPWVIPTIGVTALNIHLK